MRTDGRQHDHAQAGIDDRAAGAERIGGGAGRRRNDQAVRAIGAKLDMVGNYREFEHAANRAIDDDDVVERRKFLDRAIAGAVAMHRGLEHDAPVNRVIARDDSRQRRQRLVGADFGEKAQAAEIDSEDGLFQHANLAGDAEQGSVAAQARRSDRRVAGGSHGEPRWRRSRRRFQRRRSARDRGFGSMRRAVRLAPSPWRGGLA